MHIHTMTFDSIQSKRVAIDWILENVHLSDDLEEFLTEKKCSFVTGVELRKYQKETLLKVVKPVSYNVSEL